MEDLYFVSFINVQLDINLVLWPCYLPPENSSRAIHSDSFFNHFMSVLYSKTEEIDLYLCGGDFNARAIIEFIVMETIHYAKQFIQTNTGQLKSHSNVHT